jgi:hypothetical protein
MWQPETAQTVGAEYSFMGRQDTHHSLWPHDQSTANERMLENSLGIVDKYNSVK